VLGLSYQNWSIFPISVRLSTRDYHNRQARFRDLM